MKNRILLFVLIISLIPISLSAQKAIAGAEYRTQEDFLYGRFEASIKGAMASGMLASLFTYHTDDPEWIKNWTEIDFELMGAFPNEIQINTITSGKALHVAHIPIDFEHHLDFNSYAFEWTPDYVAWFINGTEVLRQTGPHIAEMDKECKLMMNVWQPSDHSWAGPFDKRMLPIYVYYDWVSYAAYTPGKGDTGTSNDFTQTWRDELDAYDSDRWSMATHTWDENNVDFNPANVVFRDGKMILCMTESSEDKLGFQDASAPEILHIEYLEKELLLHLSEPILASALTEIPRRQKSLTIKNIEYHPENFILAFDVKRKRKKFTLDLSALSDLQGNKFVGKVQFQNIPSIPTQFPLMINVGGPEIKTWQASSNDFKNPHYSPSGDPFKSDATIQNIPADIPAEIFQSGINDILRYSVKVPNGDYKVTLLFSEHLYTSQAQRIFDIYIEKKQIHSKLDLMESAGPNYAYTIKSQAVNVSDRQLDIYFYEYNWSGALLNGLIIERLTP